MATKSANVYARIEPDVKEQARGTRLYMKGVVRLLCVGHILNSTDQTAIDGAGARHQFASIRAT